MVPNVDPFKKVFDTLTVIVQQIDNVQRRQGSRRDEQLFFLQPHKFSSNFSPFFPPRVFCHKSGAFSFFLLSVQQSECLPEKGTNQLKSI